MMTAMSRAADEATRRRLLEVVLVHSRVAVVPRSRKKKSAHECAYPGLSSPQLVTDTTQSAEYKSVSLFAL